jgi:uncharacterized protein (DUF1015 family)
MVEVLPFQALMYDSGIVPDISLTISPPYDVISDEMREDLYNRHAFNVVRLEYSRETSPSVDKYEGAARELQSWIAQGVLKSTSHASFFLLVQNYTDVHGTNRKRKVLIARVRLVDFSEGSVLPHEHTVPKAKKDRLDLLTQCETHFSPIMAVYRDSGKAISIILESLRVTENTLASGTIPGEGAFTLAEINDLGDVAAITTAFQETPVIIADGHHRYETALEYSQISDELGAQYVMMGLIALDDPGLDIYGYHRVITGIDEGTKGRLIARVQEEFEEYKNIKLPQDSELCSQGMELLLASPESANWDVALLHESGDTVLLRVRKMTTETKGGGARLPIRLVEDCIGDAVGDNHQSLAQIVDYDHDVASAVTRVTVGDCSLGFIMGSLGVEVFEKAVVSEGRLPRKSTYFHPKLPAGVVMCPLWND